MRRQPGIIHPQLLEVILGIGHTQTLYVVDSGFPRPPGVRCIDLSLTLGTPTMLTVLEAVLAELVVESLVLATELRPAENLHRDLMALARPGCPVETVAHTELKSRSAAAYAIVRTGDTTPYANVGLVAGVSFS